MEKPFKMIKINNNKYDIYFVKSDDDRLLMEDGEYHCGITNFIQKEIYIREGLCEDSLQYTLIHEITHAFIESYGFLQVCFNDEIVADFVANNAITILNIVNKILE